MNTLKNLLQTYMAADSAFVPALHAISAIKSSEHGEIETKSFFDACRTVLPVLDKLGPSMAVIRSDIAGNIQRLERVSDIPGHNLLYEIVRKEAAEGTAKKPSSFTNAVLWLTRAMDFAVVLFRDLLDHPDWTMQQVIEDSYTVALKKWHGWISAAAFNIGLKLIPERKKFIGLLGNTSNLNEDAESFISSFSPILQENHAFLQSLRLDKMKSP